MNYTNHNVPIICAECTEISDGVENTVEHILNNHDYSYPEAILFAEIWMDEAYERIDEEQYKMAMFAKGRRV